MKRTVLELKGIGHPDTVCDKLSDIAINIIDTYNAYEGKSKGIKFHANFDKCYLKSGIVPVFIIGGNLSMMSDKEECNEDWQILKQDIEREIKNYFYTLFPDSTLFIEYNLAIGNDTNLSKTTEKNLSNDTSYVTAFFPFSYIEEYVLQFRKALEDYFGEDLSKIIGLDYKIMVAGDTVIISQCFKKNDVVLFEDYKKWCDSYFKSFDSEYHVEEVIVNPDFEQYGLWVNEFGSSIFGGDCGANGRGNDFYGFSSPMRPSNNEAFSGKNCNHPAKYLYEKALERAKAIYYNTYKFVNTVNVVAISKIGNDLHDVIFIETVN